MRFIVLFISFLFLTACGQSTKDKMVAGFGKDSPLIKYQYKKGEITAACDKAISQTDDLLAEVKDSYELDTILADLGDELNPMTFMKYVSENKDLRDEAGVCEEKESKYMVSIFTRKELYDRIKNTKPNSPEDKLFLREVNRAFELNGMALSEEKLKQFKALKEQLAELESKFSKNLTEDTTKVEYTEKELEGVPADVLKRAEKAKNGKYILTTKYTDYFPVMENAKNPISRKRMEEAYTNRAAKENSELLKKAVNLRAKAASILGKKTWAHYRIQGRMAKNPEEAVDLLNGLQKKLKPRLQADQKQLLAAKREMENPKAKEIRSYDWRYFSNQIKKKEYSLDDEEIRQYFPKDYVMQKMFDIYEKLLGVKFTKVKGAATWSDEVVLYETSDAKSGEVISYFFTDLFPRDGKYGHAAAFTLIKGRQLPDGGYAKPVSSIVCNFTPPTDGKPSLLTHDEVETLFHEFGHIMHQTLTTAPHASVSGTSVARDFVEAPSQMLENWVWDADMLKKLSGHYKDSSKKLPDNLIQQITRVKDFQQGFFYSRQILLGKTDLTMHMSRQVKDVNDLYRKLYKEILGIRPLYNSNWMAGFGHMMGGYDSGYYGYIWSEVYAADMFTAFKKEGLLDQKVGMNYRTSVLEQGGMFEPIELITQFLGRKPNNKAFLAKLGVE